MKVLIASGAGGGTAKKSIGKYFHLKEFGEAFKNRFEQTPKSWRNGGYKEYSNKILSICQTISLIGEDYACFEPTIVKTHKKRAYYIREKGLGQNSKKTWQKLKAWIYTNEIKEYSQIGIYHDNPIITNAKDCHYVAAITLKAEDILLNSNLPYFNLYDGLCAKFSFEGNYCDILKLIQWVYHYWLPSSGYEATTIPSYIKFEKNDYFDNSGKFVAKYYLPIAFS